MTFFLSSFSVGIQYARGRLSRLPATVGARQSSVITASKQRFLRTELRTRPTCMFFTATRQYCYCDGSRNSPRQAVNVATVKPQGRICGLNPHLL